MNNFFTHDGLQLAYEDEGTGLPVLCLAGLTRNMRDFDDVAAQIGADCRMIRMDYRGRGASDYADPASYAVPVEARDAIALLDHLGIERAVILGTSRGGLIAMVLGVIAPERLAGVVLNDVGPALERSGLEKIMGYLGRTPKWADYDTAAEALAAQNGAEFPDVPLERWRVCAERWWVQTEAGMALRYDAALRDAVAAAGNLDVEVWELFDTLCPLPLGLIRGSNSDLLSAETAAKMRARCPDMAYGETPNRGHVPFLDEPEALAVIRQVLARAA